MLVAYKLSMPCVNSWNRRWSGDGACFAIVRNYRKDPPKEMRYTYAFGDGWVAAVDVKHIDRNEARKLRAKTQGFCGYDWMVRSIERHGKITTRG